MQVSMIGLDIAKSVFHLVGQTRTGREVMKKRLRRSQVLAFFAQLPPCVVGMETCGGAHHWAREFEKLGHEVRLVAPKAVKAYVPGAKNDYNDARGICEALRSPRVRAVAVKSVEQQDIQALHRLRRAGVKQRTGTVNRLRGLLAEYGLVMPKGIAKARARVPELLEDADNGLSERFRELLAEQYQELVHLDEQVSAYDRRLASVQRHYEPARRLAEVPGIGPVLCSAVAAGIGNGHPFRNGRGFAASIGVVPHQHSTGGKPRLLGISKRGDPYLRGLFINGARAVLSRAAGKEDPLSRWALQVQQRRGFNIACVALANKLARIAWALLARGERFDPARA